MQQPSIIWTGRPYAGLAWRPHDLQSIAVTLFLVAFILFSVVNYAVNSFFIVVACVAASYLLIGRFYHDAYLRKRILYELSGEELTIWIEGREKPKCVFTLSQLRNVKPQFTTRSGRGTIELPPGGWAAQPAWMNRWDNEVPAMYPCRRLELIDDVEAVAELIRREARAARRRLPNDG